MDGNQFAKNGTKGDAVRCIARCFGCHFAQALIALLSARKTISFFKRWVPQALVIQFFQELSVLLDAGILLPDALEILANQFSHPGFQEITQDLASQVRRGVALHQAMSGYPKLFQGYMVHMVATGHESGKLAYALAMLAEHLQFLHTYRTAIRSALLAADYDWFFYYHHYSYFYDCHADLCIDVCFVWSTITRAYANNAFYKRVDA